jgi:hypothetical protein
VDHLNAILATYNNNGRHDRINDRRDRRDHAFPIHCKKIGGSILMFEDWGITKIIWVIFLALLFIAMPAVFILLAGFIGLAKLVGWIKNKIFGGGE